MKLISSKNYKNLFLPLIIACSLIAFFVDTSFAQRAIYTPTPTPDCKLLGNCQNPSPTIDLSPAVSPTLTPTPTIGPTSSPTQAPAVTSIPTSTPTVTPLLTPTVFILLKQNSPTPTPSLTPTPTPQIVTISNSKPIKIQEVRSAFVRSILAPNEIPLRIDGIFLSAFIAVGLVLLILFPAELFNSTVQSNYDEIIKWPIIHKARAFYEKINKVHALLLVIVFAILGAVINSFLSTDFGFNIATGSLILGMLIALAANSVIYDVTRSIYMKKRFGYVSKLRAHSLGLFTGIILVTISRFASFIPGYCYGIFTALVFHKNINDKENGEGLAWGASMLIIAGIIGWFLWIPIKSFALAANPNIFVLAIDAAFASFWVSMLTSTVFGLLPMRFMYGETIKNWNLYIWFVIYFTGIFLFVYTILYPAVVIYGNSDKVSWIAVVGLFLAFGVFSFLFWGYFRYRHLWIKSKK